MNLTRSVTITVIRPADGRFLLRRTASRAGRSPQGVLLALAASFSLAGCFQEHSFPMEPGEFHRISPPPASGSSGQPCETTREWLVRAASELSPLLEPTHTQYLTTADLSDAQGHPRDVYASMCRPQADLNSLIKNYYGFKDTAQAAGRDWATGEAPPPWPGFEQVWIPMSPDLSLSGRLGFANGPDGTPRRADCIVLLPGIFGDNGVIRTRDMAISLRNQGFHVLALELRGHGQTDRRYPDVYYTFGVLECQDLMRVSEWLQDRFPQVQRTGLAGVCWGGNLGLLAAWFDGRGPNDPSITPDLAKHLLPVSPRRHYTAGVITFSALLRWEEMMYETETPHSMLGKKPVVHVLQGIIRDRMRMKHHPWVGTKLRVLIDYEFCRSELTSEFPMESAYLSLRLVPYDERPCPPKMESARVPVLIVHAVNDMFSSPQAVADLMAVTKNPNVAALILRGGGHVGFFPYNQAYTYSLILNFFDPQRGPAACGKTK